jgi:hypothetical protein
MMLLQHASEKLIKDFHGNVFDVHVSCNGEMVSWQSAERIGDKRSGARDKQAN